ncbi:MAG: ParB/RepB/Spo0J family partition protein [Alphaproteobacteria bacterium]|nr:MAG: ParB/RepB/Spo0J family partition protein [Alphaproteobacteria bacterium]
MVAVRALNTHDGKDFVMTIQTVTLSQLVPCKANPRKLFDAAALEGLAASIRTDGLLHNLVVRPSRGKSFAIVSGERRFRALKLLEERGQLPDGFTVPVEVRTALSKEDSLRLSTVENLQRADLAPLEQTAALTKLVKDGEALDDLVAQTGLSATTIKRRLALNGLCKEAKAALEAKRLSLAQAEALTLGSDEDQRGLLEGIARGRSLDADDIKESLLNDRPCVAEALFPVERYTGTITTDLFAEGESSYFDDGEQFILLQQEAVKALADHHRASAPWVEVTQEWRIPDWQYEAAPEGKSGGVLINLSPRGSVEIREGLVKRTVKSSTAKRLADNPLAPRKPKAAYTVPLRRMLAHHKSIAVQEVLLASPRIVKDIAAIRSFMALEPHSCIAALARADDPQGAYRVLETQARQFAGKLGLAPAADADVWSVFPPERFDPVALYQAIKGFSDHDLDQFQTLLTALSFGQKDCERFDTKDSLFNVIAQDLKIAMRTHWRPDRSFFEKRSREQLLVVAKECGFSEGRSCLGSYKKSELVSGLTQFFVAAQSAAAPSPAQEKARAWLPEVMLFPAVDPDAMQDAQEPFDTEAEAAGESADDEGDDSCGDDAFDEDAFDPEALDEEGGIREAA